VLGHIRRLFRHSLVYGLTETVSRGTGFILVFMYARILSREEIGYRGVIYTASAFLGLFYTFGLDNAFLRFFMDGKLADRRREIFSSSFYFTALVGLLVLAFVWLHDEFVSVFVTEEPGFSYEIRLLFLVMVLDTIVIYPTLVLRAENRLFYFSLVSLARFLLFISLNLVLVWGLNRGLHGVFEANLITVLAVCVLMFPLYRKYLRFEISFPLLRRMLAFGIPTIFTLLGLRVIDIADRQLIKRLLGENSAALLGGYLIAYQLGMVGILVFVNSFRLAWQPFFLSMKTEADAGRIFSRVATYYAVFIGMAFLGITLFREEILTIYAGSVSPRLADVIPVVSFSYVLFGFYVIMLAGIFMEDKTRYLPVVTSVGAFLNVGLNLWFIPRFGVIGAAYSTAVSYTAMVAVMYVISSRVFKVVYEFRRLGFVCIVTAVPILLSQLFQPHQTGVDFFYRWLLFMIPPVVYYRSDFLLPEERNYLTEFMKYRLKIG